MMYSIQYCHAVLVKLLGPQTQVEQPHKKNNNNEWGGK